MIKKLIYILLILPVYLSGQNNFFWSHAGVTVESNLLKEGLISCWEFDETSGSTAYDAHGTNDGTIYGPTINQTGKINKAYDFDGSNDYVRVAETDFLFGSSDSWSLSAWVKADVFNSYRDIFRVDKYLAVRNLWLLRYSNTNYLELLFGNTSGTLHTSNSSCTITDTGWHHVVAIVTPDSVKLFIDNVRVANDSNGSTTWSTSSGTYLFIGSSYTSTSEPFNGLIDQPAVWRKALSENEISELYNSGNGKAYSTW